MIPWRGVLGLIVAVASIVPATITARQRGEGGSEVATVLQRVGDAVEQYFAHAQRIVCLEKVTMVPFSSGLGLESLSREIESELSLAWETSAGSRGERDIKTHRRLLTVNGHTPRPNDPRNCTTPEQTTTEPAALSMLLPDAREQYRFTLRGSKRVNGREALLLDFVEKARARVESSLVDGREDCISYTIDGGSRGRVWVDAESYEVVRLDRHVAGMIDIPMPREAARRYGQTSVLTLERSDTTIEFATVVFDDPHEVLNLPVSMIEMRETRGSGVPRLRTTTEYTDYKRFLTGSRIVR